MLTPSNAAFLTKQYVVREKISPGYLIYLPKSAIIWEKKEEAGENEGIWLLYFEESDMG